MTSASTLSGCVASLQSSLDLLSSSISTLDSGVHDFPRLTKVLQTTRHYELLPESTLLAAQSSLVSTLQPELDGMLARVDAHLDRLQRREAALAARFELQAGRLASRREQRGIAPPQSTTTTSSSSSSLAATSTTISEAGAGTAASSSDVAAAQEALRRKQIRQKKERLSYAVDRLTLQAQQRERQLRQSVKGSD